MQIHLSAQVKTYIPSSSSVGAFSIVEEGAVVEESVHIGAFCHVFGGVTLKKGVQLFDNCIIGSQPQDLKYQREPSFVYIDEGTKIREFVTVNGSTKASQRTYVGKNNYLMSYAHVGHDCQLASHVQLGNGVQLAGHVLIGDYTVIASSTTVYQWSSIGRGCFIGAIIRVVKDILPYSKVLGEPLTWAGINVMGLQKQGLESYATELKKNYRQSSSWKGFKSCMEGFPEASIHQSILDFLEYSQRPILIPWK